MIVLFEILATFWAGDRYKLFSSSQDLIRSQCFPQLASKLTGDFTQNR